ncbi:hypothetical protein A4A49_09401 [Nicotiana attenuata]|uniref:Uncharacterized protein n=1 Tax=Nicotiana attenuata TaxID=49451 RepID=A0A1J6J0J7_NICAT|nr:hypothetical protein A4A49_09401 [Nicotiana attenuata]
MMDDNELEVDGKAIEMWKSMSKEVLHLDRLMVLKLLVAFLTHYCAPVQICNVFESITRYWETVFPWMPRKIS